MALSIVLSTSLVSGSFRFGQENGRPKALRGGGRFWARGDAATFGAQMRDIAPCGAVFALVAGGEGLHSGGKSKPLGRDIQITVWASGEWRERWPLPWVSSISTKLPAGTWRVSPSLVS